MRHLLYIIFTLCVFEINALPNIFRSLSITQRLESIAVLQKMDITEQNLKRAAYISNLYLYLLDRHSKSLEYKKWVQSYLNAIILSLKTSSDALQKLIKCPPDKRSKCFNDNLEHIKKSCLSKNTAQNELLSSKLYACYLSYNGEHRELFDAHKQVRAQEILVLLTKNVHNLRELTLEAEKHPKAYQYEDRIERTLQIINTALEHLSLYLPSDTNTSKKLP